MKKNFFKQIKKLEHKHYHELALMCGAVAVLLLIATSIRVGTPLKALAQFIFVTSFYGSPNPSIAGSTFNLVYTTQGADECSFMGSYDNFAHTFFNDFDVGPNGSVPIINGISQSTAQFGIFCSNEGPQSEQDTGWIYLTETATPGPITTNLVASQASVGQSATIVFSADGSIAPTGCQLLNQNTSTVVWPSPVSPEQPCTSSQVRTYVTPVFTIPGTYTYGLAYDSGGWTGVVKTVTITVTTAQPGQPLCTLSASPGSVNSGGTTVLSYTASNATAASIDQSVGALPTNTTTTVVPPYTSTSIFNVPYTINSAQVLVVAGGGGGMNGAAGGAGGVLYNAAYGLTPGAVVTANVGAGGVGVNGANSTFGTLTAVGGGGGGSATTGGSGGTVSHAFTAGQGNGGGWFVVSGVTDGYGGGGGAGATGGAPVSASQGGIGGIGIVNPIAGSTAGQNISGVYYIGGGGGGDAYGGSRLGAAGGNGGGGAGGTGGLPGTSGTANTGGGGGGSSGGGGGGGGSGVIVVAYNNTSVSGTSITSSPVTVSPTVFTMTATNAATGQTGQCSAIVLLAAPSCTISASPNPVPTSGSIPVLSYTATNGSSGSIDNSIGALPTTNVYGTTKTIFLTSGTSWTVPSDWNNANNTIQVIGGGGGGSTSVLGSHPGMGGGGGAYASSSSLTLGSTVSYQIGTGGAGGTTAGNGGDTYFNGASCAGASVCAKGGVGGSGGAGAGGSAGSSVGTLKYSGGNGNNNSSGNGSGGGGGGAGPHGAGATGGTGTPAAYGSGGGGGAGGGSNGGPGSGPSASGGGGSNYLSTGGGAAAATGSNGNPGSNGGGGGGGPGGVSSGSPSFSGYLGGAGGAGTEWTATNVWNGSGYTGATPSGGAGGGGGGGGAGYPTGSDNGGAGGAGALYGGGGGGGGYYNGAGTAGVGGAGASGIIVITYVPLAGTTLTTPDTISPPAGVTASPTIYTMTVNGSGITNTCSVPVTITDVCTNFSGFQSTLPANATAVGTTCTCTAGRAWDGSACSITAPVNPTIISFYGASSRVRSGNSTSLKYLVTNPPASCTITGTNGLNTAVSPVDGVLGTLPSSGAITKNSRFTLTCGTVSLTTNVGLIPVFQEQ